MIAVGPRRHVSRGFAVLNRFHASRFKVSNYLFPQGKNQGDIKVNRGKTR
jgi:hypothetical protein